MRIAVLSLGTNVGDRARAMNSMVELATLALIGDFQMSPLYETAPVGTAPGHPNYYNRIVSGFFDGCARELFLRCRMIEKMLGRPDEEKGMVLPRIADVDILLFGGDIVADPDLKIPHPSLLDRRFCIEGVASILPELVHPGCGMRFDEIMAQMSDAVRGQEMRVVGE